ncbi:MAG: penicillin acylase family protein, partial [Solirubrobacteraceae bacterium]
MPRFRRSAVALCAALAALGAAPAFGAVTPEPYRHNDFGGFRNILPPGTNGSDTLAELAAFRGSGKRPAHNNDQLGMYSDLIFKAPHVGTGDISNFFKDASFGVAPGQTQSTESPRADVTILRDRGFGVPHIYGSTRGGAMFGEGYVAAEDRLFFIDVLRHAGRAQLASFAGGAAGNRSMDASVWRNSPYREADLQAQFDRLPLLFGAEGTKLQNDVKDYTRGINAYIHNVAVPLGVPNPSKLPAEYPL